MIYGFGGRIDNDSNAVTMIDEENRTAETNGYINGEFVEFSSGGGGASGMVVTAVDHPDESRVYLDKTWNEIKSAILNGSTVYVYVNGAEEHYGLVVDLYTNSSQYSVVLQFSQYDCDSADDYPKYYYGD